MAVIAGAGGLLGRSAAAGLEASGWSLVALTRAELDISREGEVSQAIERYRPQLVINCAAATDVDRCEREPDWAEQINARGPGFLARACRRRGATLVHISTDYVFDGEKQGFYTQEDRPDPRSVYARSKLEGELAVQEETDRHYIIRSSWIFGKGGKNFGSRVLEYARKGVALKGVVDQTSIPTYAPDLAARIVEIARLGGPGLYHVTNSGPATWYDFARLALDLAGLGEVNVEPVTRAELGQPAARPRNSAMRCLVSEKLGLAPLRDWRDALPEFIRSILDAA